MTAHGLRQEQPGLSLSKVVSNASRLSRVIARSVSEQAAELRENLFCVGDLADSTQPMQKKSMDFFGMVFIIAKKLFVEFMRI